MMAMTTNSSIKVKAYRTLRLARLIDNISCCIIPNWNRCHLFPLVGWSCLSKAAALAKPPSLLHRGRYGSLHAPQVAAVWSESEIIFERSGTGFEPMPVLDVTIGKSHGASIVMNNSRPVSPVGTFGRHSPHTIVNAGSGLVNECERFIGRRISDIRILMVHLVMVRRKIPLGLI